MARKLKTYQTSLGFFDLAMAAPSMKAVAAPPGDAHRARGSLISLLLNMPGGTRLW